MYPFEIKVTSNQYIVNYKDYPNKCISVNAKNSRPSDYTTLSCCLLARHRINTYSGASDGKVLPCMSIYSQLYSI